MNYEVEPMNRFNENLFDAVNMYDELSPFHHSLEILELSYETVQFI